MIVEPSPAVKLALSCIDGVDRKFRNIYFDHNRSSVDLEARKIYEHDLTQVTEIITQTNAIGVDAAHIHVRLAETRADIARSMVQKYEKFGIVDNYWINTSIHDHQKLIELEPTPTNYYYYGLALYSGDRKSEAIEPLRIAAESSDDVGTQAQKLIAVIEENLARESARVRASAPSWSRSKRKVYYILTMPL